MMPIQLALLALLFVLAVVSLVGGFMLRASISVVNMLLSRNPVQTLIQEPSIGKSIGITLVTSIVNLGIALWILLQDKSQGPGYQTVVAGMVSSFMAIVSMEVMLILLLPTSPLRAFVISLLVYFIVFVIGLVVVAVASWCYLAN